MTPPSRRAPAPRPASRAPLAGLLLLLGLATATSAQTEPAPSTAAQPQISLQLRTNIAWQIALEAADFSPGILDGVFKRKSSMALNEYAARYFPGVNPLDIDVAPRISAALGVDVPNAVVTYTITADDAAQVGGPIPDDWNEKAQLKRLNYESLADCLSEKFHCTRALLETLNPGVKLEQLMPGETLVVPNIRPFPADNRVLVNRRSANTASVTVNLGEKTIRVFDKDNNQLALFHCSIAREKAKLPDRDMKVQVVVPANPNYTFRPEMWPEVHNVTRVLMIPPGPRNPIGLAWVGLDLPGYGIHGVPKPELIGKTGSHGCFRLANWDAVKFAGMMKEGIPVKVINPERDPAAQ